jgi:hypothetical protein
LAAFMFVAELKGLLWLTVAAGWLGAGAAAGGWGLGTLTDGRHILKLFWGQDVLVLLIEHSAQEAHNTHLPAAPHHRVVSLAVG